MSVERRWINEWVGYTAGLFLGISFTAHRQSHLKHHRATNDPTEDPDMVLSASNAAELAVAWLKGVPKEWLFAASFTHFTDAEKATVRREFVAIIVTRLIVLFACADLGVTLLTLILGQLVGNAVLVTLFVVGASPPHRAGADENDHCVPGPNEFGYPHDGYMGLSELPRNPSPVSEGALFSLPAFVSRVGTLSPR